MTNTLYRPFVKTAMAPGNASNGHGGLTIDLLDDAANGIELYLGDDVGGYSFSLEHDFLDHLGAGTPPANVVASGGPFLMLNLTIASAGSGQALDADDFTAANQLTSVGDGAETVNFFVLADGQGGSAATDPLIAHVDTGTGFDFTPNSSTVEITFDSGTNKIFSIGA